jgi:hypothetical protein
MGMGITVVVRDAGSREQAVVHHASRWCACVLSYNYCGVSVHASDVACARTALQCDAAVFCNGLSNITLKRDAI